MQVNTETIDEMLKDYKKPDDVLVENGLLKQLTKALLQYALNGQVTNGQAPPNPVKSYPRFTGFDEKIEAMFARGFDARGIRKRIDDFYSIDVSLELISEATSSIADKLKAWQNRRLEPVYPIISLYTHNVEIPSQERPEQRPVHLPIGINLEGRRELLGLWTGATQDASFWKAALTGLRNRGVKDVFLVSSNKLDALVETLPSVFPQAESHLSVTHIMQASMHYVNSLDIRQVTTDLKAIYSAPDAAQSTARFAEFTAKWGGRYGGIVKLWKENWPRIISFCALPDEVRRVLSAVNALDTLHANIKKGVKKRGTFPHEEEALKLLYAASRLGPKQWGVAQYWKDALNQFELLWADRIKSALTPNTTFAATAPQTVQSDLPEQASASGVSMDFPPLPVH
jgi:putative transposase